VTKLTLRQSEIDWYVIKRANDPQDGRITDADVEGSGAEMLAIARAIEKRGRDDFKRCAVNAHMEPVLLWSPRNSQEHAEIALEVADQLAREIRAKLKVVPVVLGEDDK